MRSRCRWRNTRARAVPDVASHAIVIAVLSNTVVKTGMVVALGTPALRGSILVATVGILVAGVGAILLT